MKKVLILSVPTGGGHHQAAKAMETFLKAKGDVDCRLLDIAENVNGALAETVSKGYIITTTAVPKLYGSLYELLDQRENPSTEATKTLKFLSQVFRKKLYAYIKEFQPDVIVSTHLFATLTLNRIAKHHPIPAKLISICTDFTLHPIWEQVKSDYFVIASELLEYQAIKKWGTKENVLPLGIPIHPKFSEKRSEEEARNLIGIEDKFTVLVMMGSMGYGTHAKDVIKKLDKIDYDFQILMVCGSNTKLKRRVERLKVSKQMKVFGFVDNIDVLMDASDCILTKPGGLSTSEALAKRLPILLVNPIPGQEDRNREFMLNNGIALNISETYGVDEAVYQLISCPFKKESLIQNMEHFAKPYATRDLCEFVISLCEENK